MSKVLRTIITKKVLNKDIITQKHVFQILQELAQT